MVAEGRFYARVRPLCPKSPIFDIASCPASCSLPPATTPQGCRLVELKATHPNPDTILPSLLALVKPCPYLHLQELFCHLNVHSQLPQDITMKLEVGPTPQIVAVLDTPNGRVEIGEMMDAFPE
jgi:hypothetical protein